MLLGSLILEIIECNLSLTCGRFKARQLVIWHLLYHVVLIPLINCGTLTRGFLIIECGSRCCVPSEVVMSCVSFNSVQTLSLWCTCIYKSKAVWISLHCILSFHHLYTSLSASQQTFLSVNTVEIFIFACSIAFGVGILLRYYGLVSMKKIGVQSLGVAIVKPDKRKQGYIYGYAGRCGRVAVYLVS